MNWQIKEGDALEVLRGLPAGHVQCVVTSPPYWGLRDYGAAGQLGLEATPAEYVERLVEVFREVRRVLRDDGTLWLNLGDSYHNVRTHNNGGAPTNTVHVGGARDGTEGFGRSNRNRRQEGLKEKDLVGIPWRVAFALQADGWYLRSDIIWHKPNPMPESVTDRPTKAHEYLFLLTKSARYFYDSDAVKEETSERGNTGSGNCARTYASDVGGLGSQSLGRNVPWEPDGSGRNRRSVWTITTKPYSGAHFAVMPPDLVEPCIKAGTGRGDLVLDPFSGAGTVGMVARRLNRDYLGIELNPEYAHMSRRRIEGDAPLFNRKVGE